MNRKTLKRKINFLKVPISNYLFKKNHRRVMQYSKYYDQLPVKKNTILYESRDGNSITDNPYAMFKYMLDHPDFKDFEHIWSVADFDKLSSVVAEYQDISNVKFVERHSKSYLKYLASCEYLVNNSTFPSFFTTKKEQIYINTWHGTPLKNMGFDIPGNPAHSQNVLRNFLSTDYLLSPNAHTTKIFTDSYKLDGLYRGEIIEEGYPRIDLTLNTDPGQMKATLAGLGLSLDPEKKSILYAPTWKGTNVAKANNDVLQIIADMDYVDRELEGQYNLLIKVHPFLYKEAVKYSELKTRLVPDFVDTNELLAAVDLLITDYSSIFFDFLVTNKPILFYTWDADAYREERGQYLKNEVLPGPFLYNAKELVEAIENIGIVEAAFKEKYKKMQEQFTAYDDGKVTERVVRYLFQHRGNLNVIRGLDARKQKILIYSGGMKNNGITSSFINLMNNMDYERYDVSCFTAVPRNEEALKNIAKVNKKVRFLFKPGLPNYRLFEVYKDKFIHNRGKRGILGERLFPEKAYVRDHARLFGKVKFDYVIDFSGYSLFWAKYLIVADARKKICFMHNDALSEVNKVVNGKRPHRINLRGLFSIYHRFDKLVSVSQGTMEVNRRNLSMYADPEKFDYVLNSLDPERILGGDELEPTEQQEIQGRSSRSIKSRAMITNYRRYPVWNTLPGNLNAAPFYLGKEFDQAEIILSREAVIGSQTYYRFSHNHRMIGWINSRSVELLPDSVISETAVDQLAKLSRPKGNDIWSAPFNVAGSTKVSGSKAYKDAIVTIDRQAQTLRSTYCRIAIKGTVIGWIDQSALTVFPGCTIEPQMSAISRLKIQGKRKLIQFFKQKKAVIRQLENRTLPEPDLLVGIPEVAADQELYPEPAKGMMNFVNMGRLSPEKAQDNLITAFSRFHAKHRNSRLYILGEGPLKQDLEALIDSLELNEFVHLVGHLDDPFAFLKKCDCFVLSSHYEGQPMVLLEAMTLGMKIIATDIVANRAVLEDGKYGLLVEDSIEGLEQGLTKIAAESNLQFAKFDCHQYNRMAMETFYQCLESPEGGQVEESAVDVNRTNGKEQVLFRA